MTIKDFCKITDFHTQNPELVKAIKDYMEMRKTIKKPMTKRAIELLFVKLNKLSNNDEEKIAILEQSTFYSWQGIFALKEKPKTKQTTAQKIDIIKRNLESTRGGTWR